MEETFTLAGPRLDWGTVVRGHWLVWLGTLRFLGKATLGALDLIHLPVTLQCVVVMLKLNVLGMKMVIFLGHLGDSGGSPALPRDWHQLKVSSRRYPHGGYGAEYHGYVE
ncbi:unnamed protein product [Prunus armeniaca]